MTVSAHSTTQRIAVFKSCSNCQVRWHNLDEFIEDPGIHLVGYMPTFDDLSHGLFLFNHTCGTTLACRAGLFAHLYDGPVYAVSKRGDGDCPGHCQYQTDLAPCPVKCNCAYVRETLQIIRQWPKSDILPGSSKPASNDETGAQP